MPKGLKIIVVVILLVMAAGFGYVLLSATPDTQTSSTAPATQGNAPADVVPAPASGSNPEPKPKSEPVAGSYVTYSADAVAAAKGKRVLFFHAPWCPQCRQLETSITAGVIPSGVTIFKVDYDSNQKLRQQYGVTIQTTLVLLDDNGGLAKKYVAYEQPSLDAVIKSLL